MASVKVPPRMAAIRFAISATSSSEEDRLPSWSTGANRMPVPADVVRRAADASECSRPA